MKKIAVYIICAVFTAGSIFLILNAENNKDVFIGIFTLLLFGIGGCVFYMLSKRVKRKIKRLEMITVRESRSKLIALIAGCLIFIVCGWLFLPFHHLFEIDSKYTTTTGYIIGTISILFGCSGLAASLIRIIRMQIIMKITDDSLLIYKGKKYKRICWYEIQDVSHNDNFLFLHLSAINLDIQQNINIFTGLIDCDIDEIEELLKEKMNNNL